MPFESYTEQITYLPEDAVITITASPTKGLQATIDLAAETAHQGYEVSPHIAARSVLDEPHLSEIVHRFSDAGITDVFIPGGDTEVKGKYEEAHDLLVALDDVGNPFEDVGITGYPEGHPFLDEETLHEAMEKKRPYATYIVTQLCYDPTAIIGWIEELRGRGIDLPVYVGIPGVVNYQRLFRISRKVGVGDSVKFLRKTTGITDFIRRLIRSRGSYTPDDLIDELAPYRTNPEYNIAGLHFYTFNEVEDTESWRRSVLE